MIGGGCRRHSVGTQRKKVTVLKEVKRLYVTDIEDEPSGCVNLLTSEMGGLVVDSICIRHAVSTPQ